MFKRLIEEILGTGMTEDDIGQRVGASQASINRIKSGNQNPKYDLGAALVALHKQVFQIASVAHGTEFGEPRDGDRRQDDRRVDCVDAQPEEVKAA